MIEGSVPAVFGMILVAILVLAVLIWTAWDRLIGRDRDLLPPPEEAAD